MSQPTTLPAEWIVALRDCLPPARLDETRGTPVCRPESDAEWAEVLRTATRFDAKVLVRGGDTKNGERPSPDRADLILETTSDAGVVRYEPGDGVVTARAGTRLGELRAVVAKGGHHLSPWLPRPEGTLGGTLAAGRSGPDRLRFGPLRHHVLGAKIAFGDGTVTSSGGALVKNVTGYDLFRLWTGSFGAFGILLEVSLRLFPKPDVTERAGFRSSSRAQALELGRALARIEHAPLAVEVRGIEDGPFLLEVVQAGTREVVDAAWNETRTLAGELEAAPLPDDWIREPDSDDCLRITARPGDLERVLASFERRVAVKPKQILVRPGIGEALLGFHRHTDDLEAVEAELAVLPGEFSWRRASDRVLRRAQTREALAPGFALMRQLKKRYDPGERFAPGRFFGAL